MIAVTTLTSAPDTSSPAQGMLLITAAMAILVPVSAARAKLVAAAVLGGSAVRFAVTGLAELTGSGMWEVTAGGLGLLLAAVAMYAAFGFELEEVDHPVQLALLRRGAGAKPLHDDMEEQVEGIAREAGVRQQL